MSGDRCDFAMPIKVYRSSQEGETRYWPAEVQSVEVVQLRGNPIPRLSNAFSKEWENLWAAYCLHFAYYNFRRTHTTLRVTPAMESKLTDHVWDLAELLA